MKYKGKSIEVIGSKMPFDKKTLWIQTLENNNEETLISTLRSSLTLLSQLRKAMQGVQTHSTLADKVAIVQVHPKYKQKILRFFSQDFFVLS